MTKKTEKLLWLSDNLKERKKEKQAQIKELARTAEDLVKAREVITKAVEVTQAQLKNRIDTLVTMAINTVFDRDFEFELIFEKKRNRLECRPIIKEGDQQYIPKDEMGGGIIDLISFAFRVVLWSMEAPRSRNVFVLDEPMKFVGKGEMLERAGSILSELSHRLTFQILCVTHEKELGNIGDTVYEVRHTEGESKVSQA